jgi:hypothetical protein
LGRAVRRLGRSMGYGRGPSRPGCVISASPSNADRVGTSVRRCSARPLVLSEKAEFGGKELGVVPRADAMLCPRQQEAISDV